MKWIDLGYDLRCPISKNSKWQVGDLALEEFAELVRVEKNRINRILSFDLNLSPRPNGIKSDHPINLDMKYGACGSGDEAYNEFSTSCNDTEEGVLVFWQVEKNAYIKAINESWFDFMPKSRVSLPLGWVCLGLDVINDQGVSEYWDVSEDFWGLDSKLPYAVNQYGLVESEELISSCLPYLPLDPFNHWIMPVKAWVREKDAHKL